MGIQTISDASCYMLSRSASKAIRSTRPTGLCREQALICPGSKNNSAGFSVSQSTNARCSSSSTRWKSRQGRDSFARDAKVQGLKSRAAFKLLEIDSKYRIFKSGQTVVDLGYAPGSWSQVAVERTKPSGRIVGIDIIPAQPPKGVSTFQGNFLSAGVQAEVKRFLSDPDRGRPKQQLVSVFEESNAVGAKTLISEQQESYIDYERHMDQENGLTPAPVQEKRKRSHGGTQRMVDVVLSDMMMNTSGINFKDHAGSMDLCAAALQFARDTLRVGGHFICKFYQGAEDKELERQLRAMFRTVHREKPESSRSESKEAFFVALRRNGDINVEEARSTFDMS